MTGSIGEMVRVQDENSSFELLSTKLNAFFTAFLYSIVKEPKKLRSSWS